MLRGLQLQRNAIDRRGLRLNPATEPQMYDASDTSPPSNCAISRGSSRQRNAKRACAVQPFAASHAAAARPLLATAGSSSLMRIATERVTPSKRTR